MQSMDSGILRAGEGQAAWVGGDHCTVKASGEDTGGAFALIEVLVPPQSGPPPHPRRETLTLRGTFLTKILLC